MPYMHLEPFKTMGVAKDWVHVVGSKIDFPKRNEKQKREKKCSLLKRWQLLATNYNYLLFFCIILV